MSVQQTDRIDFLTLDADAGMVWMNMTEERDWAALDPAFPDLKAKVNRYLGAVQSGELEEDNPEARGLPVGIRLFCAHDPTADARHILSAVKAGCEHFGVRFVVLVEEGEAMREIPIAAGKVAEIRRMDPPKKP